MKINYLHLSRRITQVMFILVIVLIPVLNILRFDSDSGNLIVLGSAWELGLKEGFYLDTSFQGVSHLTMRFFLKAVLPWIGILAIFPLLGFITGRLFCGWFCPEGTLFELFDFLTVKIFGRRNLFLKKSNDPCPPSKNRVLYVIIALLCMAIIPVLGGIALTGYVVAPNKIWSQIINWEFTFGVKAGIIGVSVYLLISSIVIRHALCKYVCSAGLMQMLFGWVSPVSLGIKTDYQRMGACTDCRKCENVCFMNVKPRLLKRDINCVNCGECIEACNSELGKGIGLFAFSASKKGSIPAFERQSTDPIRSLLFQKRSLEKGGI
jgi:polyferredoxin